jgi:hypothetical protein
MKKHSVGVLLTLAVMLGLVAAAHGQTVDALTANVPFDFVVDGTTLPAGLYSIRPSSDDPSLLLLRSEDGKPVAFVFSPPGPGSDGTFKLVFDKYEENYFLSEIWTQAGVHQLSRSRRVRKTAKVVDHQMVSVGGAK